MRKEGQIFTYSDDDPGEDEKNEGHWFFRSQTPIFTKVLQTSE